MKKMSKILVYLFVLMVALCLTACSSGQEETPPADNEQQQEVTPSPDEQQEPQADNSTILVAYFSRTGNTETVAGLIAEQLGADLYAITPAEAYPEDYQQALEIAQQQQDDDARPELADTDLDLSAYDTVFVGYPIWYGYEPMIIRTFLESYDFSGKTVIPFCTSGGSTISASEQSIAALIPQATLLEGITISGSSAADAGAEVTSWLTDLGLLTTQGE